MGDMPLMQKMFGTTYIYDNVSLVASVYDAAKDASVEASLVYGPIVAEKMKAVMGEEAFETFMIELHESFETASRFTSSHVGAALMVIVFLMVLLKCWCYRSTKAVTACKKGCCEKDAACAKKQGCCEKNKACCQKNTEEKIEEEKVEEKKVEERKHEQGRHEEDEKGHKE